MPRQLVEPMGRLLYLINFGVLLWWLLDKSREQRATKALVGSTDRALPVARFSLRLPPARAFTVAAICPFGKRYWRTYRRGAPGKGE